MKERRKSTRKKNYFFLAGTIVLILGAATLLWAATLRIPDLSDLETSISAVQSTKIYDRTGTVLLYDMSQNVRRTIVPFDEISDNMKHAAISIEDKDFYSHGGVDYKGILRALVEDIKTLSFSQGGSTITQQVVKNTILTGDKTPTRKIKEAILAEKLEKAISKDEILDIYLNGIPLGGQIYGVEEAAKSYFGEDAKDLTVAQSAYLAAMIQAPSYYSPYGNNKDGLELRKNLVLKNMHDQGYIDDATYQSALTETVTFFPRTDSGGIKAPHFVFFVINYLEQKYGEDALQHGGLKVTTTLDWTMQQDAETIVSKYGASNQKNFNASNEAAVVIDPKTGDILSMVGSRDYFDTSIEGNYNDATANRQPGSAIKPFVYSTLFEKGFTPSSILFDVPTQFNVNCAPNNFTSDNNCYSPQNFDSIFRGPMSIRDALALSINVPAVKALYMAGISPSLATAHAMGITTLNNDPNSYGLSLALGGGEVTLLDITSAYGVFANDGVRNPYRSVLKVEDSSGATLEEGDVSGSQVIPAEIAREMSDILSDNNAKAPEYGIQGSPFYFPGREVAAKTGTTNDSRDAWVIGYAPNIALGTWAGNNDNSPMVKQIAGLIVAPMWHDIMAKALADLPNESFVPPQPIDQNLKPILRGDWQSQFAQSGVHNELYWINKADPTGLPPSNPASDPEYANWEYGVQSWFSARNPSPLAPNPTAPQTTAPSYIFPVQPTTQTAPSGNFGAPIYTPAQ
jgi:1A family penicillin-binding protein